MIRAFLTVLFLLLPILAPAQIIVPTGNCALRSGSGSPEGAVVGKVCDVYLRTNGGASTTVYVKESGTGTNTGWVPVAPSGSVADLDDLTDVVITTPATGQTLTYNGSSWVNTMPGAKSFGTTVGNGVTVSTGVASYVRIPFSGTITKATALSIDPAATACSVVVDVWIDSFANYPPTDADSITAAAPITLSTDNASEDTTLSGWDTSVSAGAIAGFNVDSASGCSLVFIQLEIQ